MWKLSAPLSPTSRKSNPNLKVWLPADPAEGVRVADRPGFADLIVRRKRVASETGKRTHQVVAAISELIDPAGAVQYIQSGAIEGGVDMVPAEL